jgi:hypothetical protein
MSIDAIFWAVTVPCGAIANGLAFWIFARLRKIGITRRWWKGEDFRLYGIYWRVAAEHGWSRWPLVAAGGLFAVGCAALLLAALFLPN